MPHLGAFVPSNYFTFIYVPVYSSSFTPSMSTFAVLKANKPPTLPGPYPLST
jgi:hypothetical protein